uniref:regulator of MON1-CCZ1 complex-like n=1 Tax=Styela clava TaxID=7725 RepID=UPI00193A9AB6|nr:regulator of MON1-CCZ1 complex-like [Styela clava]
MSSNANSYLALCKNSVRFDAVTAVNNVFFDEANKQIFAVRSGGATGVIVRGPDDRTSHSFRLNDKGSLISIKFSYHHKILALQRSETSIEFANIEDGSPDPSEYSQSSKGKNNKILTFHWISTHEIVMVTQSGIEFYQINQDKRQAKLLKNYNFPVNWSIFLPESAVLLCSTSPKGTVICPFYFKNSQILRLSKFDVDRSIPSSSEARIELFERDVTMVNLYSSLYIAVLKHPPSQSISGTEVNLFLLSREAPAKKVYSLITGMSGRFAISVVDSLVIVHHQASKTSMIFDIKLPGNTSNSVTYLKPVIAPLPIASHKLSVAGFGLNAPTSEVECQLYAPTWIVFQPNIIIDAALGCMWFLQIKLDAISTLFQNVVQLFDFLLLRRGSKAVMLKVLKKMLLSDNEGSSYKNIAAVFDKLNTVYKTYTEAEQAYLQMRRQEAASGSASSSTINNVPPHRMQVVVDQSDMYTHVLSVLARQNGIDQIYVCQVVVEYIRSLDQNKLTIQHYLYELIIHALITSKNYHQLQQYIHYNLIADSRMIAGYLLSLESSYPPVYQIALDMYKRISTTNDEIVDILLAKHKILEAIRFVKSVSMHDSVSARKFLEAALEADDDLLFYETFKFFEQRNHRLRGKKDFSPGEQCEKFITHYEELFEDFEIIAK